MSIGSPEHQNFLKAAEENIQRSIARSTSDFANKNRGVFPVTPYLGIGREDRQDSLPGWYQQLHREGVTDVIRLRRDGFRKGILGVFKSYPSIHHIPIEPGIPVEMDVMRTVILRIHHLLNRQAHPQILLHCWKGEDRSPTALWMYFIALGLSEEMADRLITGAHFAAKPAEKPLIWRSDEGQMKRIKSIGRSLGGVRSDLFEELYPFPWPRTSN